MASPSPVATQQAPSPLNRIVSEPLQSPSQAGASLGSPPHHPHHHHHTSSISSIADVAHPDALFDGEIKDYQAFDINADKEGKLDKLGNKYDKQQDKPEQKPENSERPRRHSAPHVNVKNLLQYWREQEKDTEIHAKLQSLLPKTPKPPGRWKPVTSTAPPVHPVHHHAHHHHRHAHPIHVAPSVHHAPAVSSTSPSNSGSSVPAPASTSPKRVGESNVVKEEKDPAETRRAFLKKIEEDKQRKERDEELKRQTHAKRHHPRVASAVPSVVAAILAGIGPGPVGSVNATRPHALGPPRNVTFASSNSPSHTSPSHSPDKRLPSPPEHTSPGHSPTKRPADKKAEEAEARRKEAEAAERKRAEDAAVAAAAVEQQRKAREAEEKHRREAEAARIRVEEEELARKHKQEEEAAKAAAAAEAAAKAAALAAEQAAIAAEEARKKAEVSKRKFDEEEAKRKLEEEEAARRKRDEEEATRRRHEEEQARLKAEEAAAVARRKQEEEQEAARNKALEEELERKRKKEEEEAAIAAAATAAAVAAAAAASAAAEREAAEAAATAAAIAAQREAEEKKRLLDEETAKQREQEAARQRENERMAAEQAALKQKQAEEEAALRKKHEEQEELARQKKIAEEAEEKRRAEELQRQRDEEERQRRDKAEREAAEAAQAAAEALEAIKAAQTAAAAAEAAAATAAQAAALKAETEAAAKKLEQELQAQKLEEEARQREAAQKAISEAEAAAAVAAAIVAAAPAAVDAGFDRPPLARQITDAEINQPSMGESAPTPPMHSSVHVFTGHSGSPSASHLIGSASWSAHTSHVPVHSPNHVHHSPVQHHHHTQEEHLQKFGGLPAGRGSPNHQGESSSFIPPPLVTQNSSSHLLADDSASNAPSSLAPGSQSPVSTTSTSAASDASFDEYDDNEREDSVNSTNGHSRSDSNGQDGRSTPRARRGSVIKAIKDDAQRAKVVAEVCSSEKSYVSSLFVLVDEFVTPLKQSGSPVDIPQKKVSLMFSNVELLANFHRVFLTDLQSSSSNDNDVSRVFLKYADFLKMYTQYLGGYQKSLETINSLRNHKRFQQFLSEKRNKCGLDLMSYLIMPVQRVPRYELLLRELQRYTPSEHPAYVSLLEAASKITSIATYINRSLRSVEEMSQLVEVQNKIQGDFGTLLQPHRRLIRDGDLTILAPTLLKKGAVHIRHFWLFNDIMLWTTTAAKGYKFRGHTELGGATVGETPPSKKPSFPHSFQLVSANNKQTLVFVCKADEEKLSWMGDIEHNANVTTATEAQAIRRRAGSSRASASGNSPGPHGVTLIQNQADKAKASKSKGGSYGSLAKLKAEARDAIQKGDKNMTIEEIDAFSGPAGGGTERIRSPSRSKSPGRNSSLPALFSPSSPLPPPHPISSTSPSGSGSLKGPESPPQKAHSRTSTPTSVTSP